MTEPFLTRLANAGDSPPPELKQPKKAFVNAVVAFLGVASLAAIVALLLRGGKGGPER